jgi:hypothetical protein
VIPVEPAELLSAAQRLDRYLREHHLHAGLLVGPDPGVRFNARIYRFFKSYLRAIPWRDDLVYMQAQKYWIEANIACRSVDVVSVGTANDTIRRCGLAVAERQQPAGYWEYPNPEWSGRIATVEGNYAAIGLLLAHGVDADDAFVDAARRWHDYAVRDIGFQQVGDTMAINYFANRPGGRIPNNAASAVRTFAMLADATGDDRFLEYVGPMVRFMADAQLDSGELPYGVVGEGASSDRVHFLCQQYNAFQFMNLADFRRISDDSGADEVLARLAAFLDSSLLDDGRARYDCESDSPEVLYYAVACARALSIAARLGLVEPSERVDRAFRRVLSAQMTNGSFPYSRSNYGVLHDLRPYPRYLAMILTFLAQEAKDRLSES